MTPIATFTATFTATLAADKSAILLAAFDFHAVPFTRENTTDDHLRLPFLDEALAGRFSAALARMPAAIIAPAGAGKTALLRRLCSGLLEARDHVPGVEVTGLSKRNMGREIVVACGAAPAASYPMRVRRLRPRRRARRRS